MPDQPKTKHEPAHEDGDKPASSELVRETFALLSGQMKTLSQQLRDFNTRKQVVQEESAIVHAQQFDNMETNFPGARVVDADAKTAVSTRVRTARSRARQAGESAASDSSDRDVPDVLFDASAIPILSGHVTVVLDGFLTLLNNDVRQKRIDMPSIEVRGTVDPEDGTAQILVKAWVRGLSESESRTFYYDFGVVVDAWSAELPIELRTTFATMISLQVRRVQDA